MEYGFRFLYKRYHLPIIITENRQACNDRVFLDGAVHDPARRRIKKDSAYYYRDLIDRMKR